MDLEEVGAKKNIMNSSNTINGFSPVTPAPVFWKSRKRSSSSSVRANNTDKAPSGTGEEPGIDVTIADKSREEQQQELDNNQESNTLSVLSEKRKALFEPLEPMFNVNGKRPSAESLLPPPDFETATYPRGWLIGKKRKLVNVDVVESMRRIAVQEMNRKDREIDGLNEQLEEDARCLEHLQLQLLDERSKRSDLERQNAMLQNQVTMLMDMLQDNEGVDDDGTEEP